MEKKALSIVLLGIVLCVGIYIGVFIGRQTIDNPSVPANSASNTQDFYIDLNNCTLEELMDVPGLGKTTALQILANREEYGDYIDVSELKDVPGISRELYDEIKRYFIVGG